MPNVSEIANGLLNRPAPAPYGNPPVPQGPGFQGGVSNAQQVSYPPAPQIKKQNQPTEIKMSDFKYNAFNVDQLSLNITNRRGFDGITPDMMIWNYYQYNVKDIAVNANETELTNFVAWALQDAGIQNVKIDFHPGNKVTLSGKYPIMGLPLPFSAEISISLTPFNQVLLTIDDFSTGFTFPSKMRDTIIGLLVDKGNDNPNSPPPSSPLEAFSLSDAMQKIGPNQIMIDFSKMKVPLNLPISRIATTESGFSVVGGSDNLQPKQK